jgi:hypothetical protein
MYIRAKWKAKTKTLLLLSGVYMPNNRNGGFVIVPKGGNRDINLLENQKYQLEKLLLGHQDPSVF